MESKTFIIIGIGIAVLIGLLAVFLHREILMGLRVRRLLSRVIKL